MKLKLNFLFLIILFAMSCSTKENSTDRKTEKSASVSDEIKYTMTEFKKTLDGCNPESDSCSYMILKYPLIQEGKIMDVLNSYIITYIKDSIWAQEGFVNSDFSQMASNFFTARNNDLKLMPGRVIPYFLNVSSEVKYQTTDYLTLSVDYFIFTGGAHPNSYNKLTVFDKSSGKILTLSDIFKPGFETELNKQIDLAFRKMKGLSPEDNLAEKAGLFENKIAFNNNFGLSETGIEFFYNNYEIAPYVSGSTDLKIPLTDLKNILIK